MEVRRLGVFLLLCVFLGAPLLHDLIPHTHSHDVARGEVHDSHGEERGGEESAIWMTMHSATHHDEKKLLVAIVSFVVLFLFVRAIAVKSMESAHYEAICKSNLVPFEPERGFLLRRGISPHRRFA